MRYLIVLLALAGIVVSGLALKVHYDTGSEPCRINDKWDCGVVNHSPYAVFHGVPVAAIGIAGYLLIAILGFLRRQALLLLAVLRGTRLCAVSDEHRSPRSGRVVSVLRDLAGDHRGADFAGPDLVGMGETSRHERLNNAASQTVGNRAILSIAAKLFGVRFRCTRT